MEASIESPREPVISPTQVITTTSRAKFMFWLSLCFIGLGALLFPHAMASEKYSHLLLGSWIVPAVLLMGWAFIIGEGILGFMESPDGLRAAPRFWLTALLPGFRMGVASAFPNRMVWLPRWGWVEVSRHNFERMERRLALPMLWITLLILPVLVLEIFWGKAIESSFLLGAVVHVFSALIWFAFAVEFILLFSLSDDKLFVCKHNWINIVIIILPVIAFLRVLRVAKFFRMVNAGKMLRVYRLRGIMTRAMRLALLFNLIDRLMQRNPEKYLVTLDRHIQHAEKELSKLKEKRLLVKERIAEPRRMEEDLETYLPQKSDRASS